VNVLYPLQLLLVIAIRHQQGNGSKKDLDLQGGSGSGFVFGTLHEEGFFGPQAQRNIKGCESCIPS
jgi:hypothetical protein